MNVGASVGIDEGDWVGVKDGGSVVGENVGKRDGVIVGLLVGAFVGAKIHVMEP